MRACLQSLLGLVVPPLCAVCREPERTGASLCPACRRRLVAISDPRCRRCGAPTVRSSGRCPECRGRRLAFDSAWAPFAYEGVCRDVVAALKTRGALAVAGLMADEIVARAPLPELATLVPVPAHRRRSRRHGFNPAAAIAGALARRTGCQVADLLVRTGSAVPQVGLERSRRLANARESVRLAPRAEPPDRVTLVDDVYTTGATLDACARALEEAGAGQVSAVTFSRAVRYTCFDD